MVGHLIGNLVLGVGNLTIKISSSKSSNARGLPGGMFKLRFDRCITHISLTNIDQRRTGLKLPKLIEALSCTDFDFKVCLATSNAMQVWREEHKQTSALQCFLFCFPVYFEKTDISIFNILTLCQHRYFIYIEFRVTQS